MTLVQVLEGLRQEGYDGTFVVDDDGTVRCRTCGSAVAPVDLQLDGIRRLEGSSDPADEAAVLAVRCPVCERLGAIVARYGPEAGPADEALLLAVEDRRGRGLDVADRASRREPPRPRSA